MQMTQVHVIYLDKFGKKDNEEQINIEPIFYCLLVQNNFIEINDITYRIHKVKIVYKDGFFEKIQIKVHSTYVGEF